MVDEPWILNLFPHTLSIQQQIADPGSGRVKSPGMATITLPPYLNNRRYALASLDPHLWTRYAEQVGRDTRDGVRIASIFRNARGMMQNRYGMKEKENLKDFFIRILNIPPTEKGITNAPRALQRYYNDLKYDPRYNDSESYVAEGLTRNEMLINTAKRRFLVEAYNGIKGAVNNAMRHDPELQEKAKAVQRLNEQTGELLR